MLRFLHFLALFGYLNVLCYEVKYCSVLHAEPIAASDTFLEVVLEEILDVAAPVDHENLPSIVFDDYRILFHFFGLIPVVLYFTGLLRRLFHRVKAVIHPAYSSKTRCLPGYYTFLYRYRPF